jgi:hypothetical protein
MMPGLSGHEALDTAAADLAADRSERYHSAPWPRRAMRALATRASWLHGHLRGQVGRLARSKAGARSIGARRSA